MDEATFNLVKKIYSILPIDAVHIERCCEPGLNGHKLVMIGLDGGMVVEKLDNKLEKVLDFGPDKITGSICRLTTDALMNLILEQQHREYEERASKERVSIELEYEGVVYNEYDFNDLEEKYIELKKIVKKLRKEAKSKGLLDE